LGYLNGDPTTGQPVGSFDRTNGRPTWSDVTGSSTAPAPTPNPCTYTYSAWSTCTNGQQTRTVTSATPSGCTGTPILTQSCTTGTTPPPTGGALLTRSNVSQGSANYSEDITDITVRRVVLTGFVNTTGAGGWASFAVAPGAQSLNYLGLYPDGNWYLNGQRCTVSTADGVTTITLPVAFTINRLGTWQGQSGALRYTATRVELFAQ
jgi:hypothetical protein